MGVEPLKLRVPSRLRIVDDVVRILEGAILSGQLSPGERLVEARIADELGISRTTVREAILKLERERLVETRPRRGSFVTRLGQEDALDLGYARALIEGFALVVGRRCFTDSVWQQLERQLQAMAGCSLPDDLPQLIAIDLAFHRALVEPSASPRLIELWSGLNGQIGALFLRGIERQHAGIDDVVAHHRSLLEGARSHDPAQLQRAVLEHYVRPSQADAGRQVPLQAAIAMLAPHYLAAKAANDASTSGQQHNQ